MFQKYNIPILSDYKKRRKSRLELHFNVMIKKRHPIRQHLAKLTVKELRILHTELLGPLTDNIKSKSVRLQSKILAYYFKNHWNAPLTSFINDKERLNLKAELQSDKQHDIIPSFDDCDERNDNFEAQDSTEMVMQEIYENDFDAEHMDLVETLNELEGSLDVEPSSKVKQENEEDPLQLQIKDIESTDEKTEFNCDECGKIFPSNTRLYRHFKTVHENLREYNCEECEKSFNLKENLTRHIKGVHGNFQYSCDKCDKSFSRKEALKTHIQSVHEKVRYNCDQCDKNFCSNQYLSEHIQIVHENLRYNCDQCDKSYSGRTTLREHILSVHENIGIRYNCDLCEKSFAKKDNLNRHIKSIHENIQFVCDYCQKKFNFRSNYIKHVKRMHENVPI